MLREDNELLWHVGRGTPMGDFMRRFWVPATLSSEIAAGGSPQRVRLLGQNMVAFRAHDGRLGVLDEGCPHRGVSLALARNADCALTCIFHGWKIDVTGKVLDVPPEPAERRAAFAARVKVRTYPVCEAAGIVWIWMSDGEPAPFPALNWIDLPLDHIRCSVGIVRANWVFGIEGQLDSAHVGILHKDWADRPADTVGSDSIANAIFDSSPRLEFEDQPYGYREAALRTMPDGRMLARVREYMMPWYSYIPSHGGRAATQLLTISVPIDDDTSAQWDVYYNLTRSIERDNFPVPAGVRNFTHLSIADRFGPGSRRRAGRQMVGLFRRACRGFRRRHGAACCGESRTRTSVDQRPLDRLCAAHAARRGQEARRRRDARLLPGRDRLGPDPLLRGILAQGR
jgi:nitrite reductase/ring-hydroxylating ferredoxin subunit